MTERKQKQQQWASYLLNSYLQKGQKTMLYYSSHFYNILPWDCRNDLLKITCNTCYVHLKCLKFYRLYTFICYSMKCMLFLSMYMLFVFTKCMLHIHACFTDHVCNNNNIHVRCGAFPIALLCLWWDLMCLNMLCNALFAQYDV